MTNKALRAFYQDQVDSELIQISLIEYHACPQDSIFVEGHFNPYFEEESLSKPIEITLVVNTIDADLINSSADFLSLLDEEFVKTVNHEMCHLEQYREGRFIFDWEGEYMDNPNEKEAYAAEGSGSIFH